MHRLPLADELPYQFLPPKVSRFWVRATRGFRRRMLRAEHRVDCIDVQGIEHLQPLLRRGDGVLLAPNHSDRADGLVMLDLADRIGRPMCAMAMHQLFAGSAGVRRWLFPRLGLFPVDREGSDLAAVKAAVEILSAGVYPLLVFPEGEVYHLTDRLTPLREGVAFLAASAVRKKKDGKTVWIVPVGLKYRFLDGHDPMPAMLGLMDRLEHRFTWWNRRETPLVERIYQYAEAMLTLKELEYLRQASTGPLTERIANLRSHIVNCLEDRHLGKRQEHDSVPSRVNDLRRHCLEMLKRQETSPETADQLRRDLNDAFVAVQLFSYPGDYLRENPTVERASEVLTKYEEDVLGSEVGAPHGPRRAVLNLGAPIDVAARLNAGGKLKAVVGTVTTELEGRIQGLLDAIGQGRHLECQGATRKGSVPQSPA
jgi:1-acyl-sn-glycerol-3-phosphate acyltransferase